MKKELKNVRIVADNGETMLLTKRRFCSLLQTLDVLANSVQDAGRRPRAMQKTGIGRD